ncbi:MAG: malto-oligosyltrehalose trehalohydrolase [Pyrinomonadaceae bacterium]|nr:malto-oligosyltrehalose trehalohydrolase [Pyrinomonadaceae bacterium]
MSSAQISHARTDAAWELEFGARPQPDGSTRFRVWAPRAQSLSVKIFGESERTLRMERSADNLFEALAPDVGAGADYKYIIDDERERPDPVSRWQPEGVHGPSRVVDPEEFDWTDEDWKGVPLKDLIVYELHVGTFTPEGTFEAAIEKLPYLKNLGITAIEIMPVAEFPGGRNWGYDGAHLYAPQSTYGGPHGLKTLVDACHRAGLAVILDVVYNHLGPEGNYLGEYAPIFSKSYRTPWGDALNFDSAESDGVRRYFVENALYWLTEYHVDGLRLDAIHRIMDKSPKHILQEIAEEFERQARLLGRMAWTIAESDLNDVRVIKPREEGGYGLNAQWSDDFHHSLHAVLTGTGRGYFADFGRMEDVAKSICEGFVYDGRRSEFRKRRHGTPSADLPGERFVVFTQNHDQIANGYWGDRLAALVTPAQQRIAAALLLTAPNLPLFFMGQEWGETAPFLYFTSHTDENLAEGVREGRKEEYASFLETEEIGSSSMHEGFADPQDVETFNRSKLNWSLGTEAPHRGILNFYRELLALRREHPSLSNCDKRLTRVQYDDSERWIAVERGDESGEASLLVCNLSADARSLELKVGRGRWRLILWSNDAQYGGEPENASPPPVLPVEGEGEIFIPLSGWSACLYMQNHEPEG